MPGADSGTFDYFTEEINGEVDAATQFATPSEDDNVLVTGVAGDVNAIGFFGYAYFIENEDKVKAIGVDGGDGCVEPTEETINDNSYAPLSRPLFIYPSAEALERPEVQAFVQFYVENAALIAEERGFVGLTEEQQTESQSRLDGLLGG
jgi:phosphate transport system substrate-binding protein